MSSHLSVVPLTCFVQNGLHLPRSLLNVFKVIVCNSRVIDVLNQKLTRSCVIVDLMCFKSSTCRQLFSHAGGGELYTWGSNENGCLGTGYLLITASQNIQMDNLFIFYLDNLFFLVHPLLSVVQMSVIYQKEFKVHS